MQLYEFFFLYDHSEPIYMLHEKARGLLISIKFVNQILMHVRTEWHVPYLFNYSEDDGKIFARG